ncbi:DUF5305 domain-containing protein [Halorubellus sp. PRR65]|uniref:DUF5305 domain-containing protein n=1 Tax=Halorubellus sp. PRR65 TaxID=3098148 RepID=UPI002B25BFA6|nr:DUF5305 domain-containing protein [Halorubellus sp. PRR65]
MIGGIRTRAILDEYATVLVVVALALAVVGGAVAYDAHATPDERQVERTVEDFRVDGSFAHQATVREGANTTTFEPGATVHNRSVYFSRVMPTLAGRLSLRYADADSPATVRVSRRLVVQSASTGRDEADRTVYWRDVRSLGSNATTLAPGDRTTVPFSLNVSETLSAARNESARLGAPGTVQTRVVFDVTVDREGASGNETLSFVLPVTSDGSVYRVEDGPRSVPFNHTATTTVADPPGVLRSVGGPLALVVGLLGVISMRTLRRSGALDVDDAELAALAYREDRADYADWITEGRLPSTALDRPRVVVDSLAGLADVAIDAGERVVHDRDRGEYVVVHDDLLYVFEPPADPYDAPVDDAPADDVPDDEAAAADALAATDAPADGAPDDDAPVDDAPADDADPPTLTAEALDPEDLPFGDADARDPDAVLDDGSPDVDPVDDSEDADANPEDGDDDTEDADDSATTGNDERTTVDAGRATGDDGTATSGANAED